MNKKSFFNLKVNFKDPKTQIVILLILLSIGGIYLWYTYSFSPLQIENSKLKNTLRSKQDTLRVIQALKPQLELLKKDVVLANKQLDSLKSIFPDQKEIPKLIREITAVASAAGIITTKFNPLPDIEKEYYIENRYSITVEGGYHQLAEFFAFLSNFPLIINLSSVNIASNPEYKVNEENSDEKILNPATIVAMFEMTTFSSKK